MKTNSSCAIELSPPGREVGNRKWEAAQHWNLTQTEIDHTGKYIWSGYFGWLVSPWRAAMLLMISDEDLALINIQNFQVLGR